MRGYFSHRGTHLHRVARLLALCALSMPAATARAVEPSPATPAIGASSGADLLACPASDLLDVYWTGVEVRARRAGLTTDKNRVYEVTVASDIPAARMPLVPVVEDLVLESVVAAYDSGTGPELVFYEMVSVCGSPEEESDPD